MELWTRANDSSQAELVRRVVREFLDRRPLKELGIDIDSSGSAPGRRSV
jgi:hypothetical protein